MGFLAPWFFGGLLAVGLPVWLHLLRQHRTPPLPFSSLMLFERHTQSSVRHRRLRYFLLFALRTALVVLLVIAFTRPFIRSAPPLLGGKRLLVVAIDNSFSMRQDGRLARAKTEAASVLSSVRPGDRSQIIAFARQAEMVSAAGAVQPSDERGSFAELSRTLRSLAQSSHLPVEAHLFSDMQKSGMPSSFSDLRLGNGIRLVTHPVAGRREANFAVENVIAPRHLYDPKKVRIQATVAGYGTERAIRRVSLALNGRELASRPVEVPANGRGSVEFLSMEAPYGMNRGEIRIDSGDGFPDDDRYCFSIQRSDPRPALFVHEAGSNRGLLYFRAALDASPDAAFALDAVTADRVTGVALSKYAFVVLSDVSGVTAGFEQALRGYARAGGSVLIALGRSSALARRVPIFDADIREERYATPEGERFQSAAWLDGAHPSIGAANRWDDVKFYHTIRLEPGSAAVIARLTDDTPLLMEKKIGEGRVMVFASTFDNIANDFPLHAAFVPFIDRAARYLGGLEDRPASQLVGSFLDLRAARESRGAIEVLDPSGARVFTLSESARARTIRLSRRGFYEVHWPNARHELIAVNPDRHESDLDVIPGETLALWRNTGLDTASRGPGGEDTGNTGIDLWWYIMLLALVAGIAESLIGNRHLAVEDGAAAAPRARSEAA